MRRLTGIVLVTLIFAFALAASVLAAEQETITETPQEEQVAEQTLDDKGDVEEATDTDEQSWSNVKALWG